MKVLFYSPFHFNAETYGPYLEVMQKHIDAGDDVTFLTCNGELSSCQVNPHHSMAICETCKSMRKSGVDALSKPVRELHLKEVFNPGLDLQLDKIDCSSIENFKSVFIENFDIGSAIYSSMVSMYRNPKLDLKVHKKLIENQWKSCMQVYDTIKNHVQKEQYDLVYVFNGRFSVLRACLRACQAISVDCYMLEGGRNYTVEYAIYKNHLPHSISDIENLIEEKWKNGSEDKVEQAKEFYHKRSKSKDVELITFTKEQKEGLLPQNWDASKTNIAVFISSEDEFVSVGEEWKNPIYTDQVEGIVQICKSFLENESYHFYVRVHPNLTGILNASMKELYALRFKNLTVIPGESKVSSYTMLRNCEKVLSFGSTVGIEATAMGKVSILAGQSFYKNLDATYNPNNHQEVVELLQSDLEGKSPLGAYKYANYLLNFSHPYRDFSWEYPWQGRMRGKLVKPNWLYAVIRSIGRKRNIAKKEKQRLVNQKKIRKLLGRNALDPNSVPIAQQRSNST